MKANILLIGSGISPEILTVAVSIREEAWPSQMFFSAHLLPCSGTGDCISGFWMLGDRLERAPKSERCTFFPRKWVNCILVQHYNDIIQFPSLLPPRAFRVHSVEFLPTKENEVLISAYKKKTSCLWFGYGWLAVAHKHSLKENWADNVLGSFLFAETNATLIHQGRGMLAGNPRSQ